MQTRSVFLRLSGLIVLIVLIGTLLSGCAHRNRLLSSPAMNEDFSISTVIENPAGSSEKWEVQANGRITQDRVDGTPIEIAYLPWPVNGGMIPRTLHSEALGGDREPLDVLVLGPARDRGDLVRAIPIGLLRVVDRLERDDKVLAVVPGGVFGELRSVEDLEENFPGVREILTRWYAHSRPGGGIDVQGFGSRAAARLLIADCATAFEDALRAGTLPTWQRR